MKQKISLVVFILLALLFPATNFLSAQVAAPPTGPLVTSINPSSGEQGKLLGLTISGENFQKGATVSFNPTDGIFINSINFISATEIIINITIAGSAPLSPRDVIITNPNQLTGTYKEGFTVKPASDATPPPILGLTATDAMDGKTDLAWIKSDVGDFSYYAIYWSETDFSNVSDLVPAAKISDQATTTYQATGLTDGTKYYFAVTAVDQNSNEDKNVLTVSATPTPSTVPPVTIPFPTAPAVNVTPVPSAPAETEKPTGEVFPADLIPIIIIVALAALGGLIYSLKKRPLKKSPEENKTEIKKEKSFRFLNAKSKLKKLEINLGAEKIDLIREIINLWKTPSETKTQLETILGVLPPEYETAGIPIDSALQIFDTQKDTLQKIIGGPSLAKELNALEYAITIEPISGVDIEWQIAEVSLGGLQPTSKYEIKKQGDDFTYTKNVRVLKTDEAWKKYANDQAPDSADLKKIVQVHLGDLGEQEKKYKNL